MSPSVGGVGNGVLEEDPGRDSNPGAGQPLGFLTMWLGKEKPLDPAEAVRDLGHEVRRGVKGPPAAHHEDAVGVGAGAWLAEHRRLEEAGVGTGIRPAELQTSVSVPGDGASDWPGLARGVGLCVGGCSLFLKG